MSESGCLLVHVLNDSVCEIVNSTYSDDRQDGGNVSQVASLSRYNDSELAAKESWIKGCG